MDLEQLCCLWTWNAVLLWTSSINRAINRAGHRALQLICIGVKRLVRKLLRSPNWEINQW